MSIYYIGVSCTIVAYVIYRNDYIKFDHMNSNQNKWGVTFDTDQIYIYYIISYHPIIFYVCHEYLSNICTSAPLL